MKETFRHSRAKARPGADYVRDSAKALPPLPESGAGVDARTQVTGNLKAVEADLIKRYGKRFSEQSIKDAVADAAGRFCASRHQRMTGKADNLISREDD